MRLRDLDGRDGCSVSWREIVRIGNAQALRSPSNYRSDVSGCDRKQLVYEFSRLYRNPGLGHSIRKRLELAGKTAFEASSGLDIFNLGSLYKDVQSAQYIEDIRVATRRGMKGAWDNEFWVGAAPYGYHLEPIYSGKENNYGERIHDGVKLRIDDAQAAVVRRIFRLYTEGNGLKNLARAPATKLDESS